MRSDLPSGTVTFLFTDVEGSTRLLHELGAEDYADALAEHRRIIREACTSDGGVEVDTQGDAFLFAFPTAPGALAAALAFTEGLASGPIRVRVGLHTGTPLVTNEGYIGEDLHRAARIAACGHGGQVLVSSSTAQLVELELVDLGEHRLKDLSAPERVYQLGADEFPALKSLYRTNLPVPATPFLGREQERAEVVDLRSADDARLLTLTGPGGTGKTRLALQAAGMASDAYPDGVWWIPLAPLRDPALVLATAGQLLGSKNGLAEHIADKAMLCLFDNFEQVVEAAPELAALLSDCPNLDVLVTSRERLHLTSEQEYPVPPLAHEEGVGFFLARARAVKPGFAPDEAVSEICARLDDLPLALELASARVKALSTAQLLQRLDERLPLLTGGAKDLPERQQTLRATIAWSYDLLSDEQQQLFSRLAVFRGGCTLEAAEDIAAADLDTLQSLVDKSLVRHSNERYWMLETIREYAVEKLEESSEVEGLRKRHAEWFLALARTLEPHAPVAKDWLDSLEPEHDNIRAALDRLPAQGDTQLALDLAESVWRFWKTRGYQWEAERRFESLLALDPTTTASRGHALNAAAGMAIENGKFEIGRRHAWEALDIHTQNGDAWGIARSTFMLGYAEIESENFEAAQPLFEETVRLMTNLGHEQYIGIAKWNLAWACRELGDTDRARALHEENLLRVRSTGSTTLEAHTLESLGFIARTESRTEEGLSMMREALRLRSELGERQNLLLALSDFASFYSSTGSPQVAARLLACCHALYDDAALRIPVYQQKEDEQTLARLRQQLDDTAFAEAWKAGTKLSLDEAVALALGDDT